MGSVFCLFFFKQKTAYDMRISDWSSDVCSSDLAELAELRRAVNVPVAAGERCFSRFDIANLVNAAAVDVLQPDVAHIGGVTEMVLVNGIAESFSLPVAPHNPNGPVCNAASIHAALAWEGVTWLEDRKSVV